MGEYYIICNFEKREVLNPEVFDCAHKPGDFIECTPRKGILHGLMHLLSLSGSIAGTKRRESDHLFGRWAGDRIAIIGDYYNDTIAGVAWDQEAYCRVSDAQDDWVDISEHVVYAIGGEPDLTETGPRSLLNDNLAATIVGGRGELKETV